MIGQIEQKALRLEATANSLPERLAANVNLPGLHHFVGTKAIEVCEGCLPDKLSQRILWIVSQRFDMPEVLDDVLAAFPVLIGQVGHPGFVLDVDLSFLHGVDAELSLENLRNRILQELAALRHHVAEFVANCLVHRISLLQNNLDTFVEQLEQV